MSENQKEYWVNVYEGPLNSVNWPTKYEASLASLRVKANGAGVTLYRIHVKMKPKPTVKHYFVPTKAMKFNWMD